MQSQEKPRYIFIYSKFSKCSERMFQLINHLPVGFSYLNIDTKEARAAIKKSKFKINTVPFLLQVHANGKIVPYTTKESFELIYGLVAHFSKQKPSKNGSSDADLEEGFVSDKQMLSGGNSRSDRHNGGGVGGGSGGAESVESEENVHGAVPYSELVSQKRVRFEDQPSPQGQARQIRQSQKSKIIQQEREEHPPDERREERQPSLQEQRQILEQQEREEREEMQQKSHQDSHSEEENKETGQLSQEQIRLSLPKGGMTADERMRMIDFMKAGAVQGDAHIEKNPSLHKKDRNSNNPYAGMSTAEVAKAIASEREKNADDQEMRKEVITGSL